MNALCKFGCQFIAGAPPTCLAISTNALTVQYDRVMFILEPNEITRDLARKNVTIYDFPDGRIEVRHQGLTLHDRTFDKNHSGRSGRFRRKQTAQRGAGDVPGHSGGCSVIWMPIPG